MRSRTAASPVRRLVVLTPGWSGERVLIRLLSASGAVRVVGRPLARPVDDAAGHLRARLAAPARGVPCALVAPSDLSLLQWVDPGAFVRELVETGCTVVSLRRDDALHRGLSRAVCGLDVEVLPSRPLAVDPAEVVVHRDDGAAAVTTIDELGDAVAARFALEHDLADATARQATADRVADALGIARWPAPPELEVPDGDALWSCVADPAGLRAALDALGAGAGG